MFLRGSSCWGELKFLIVLLFVVQQNIIDPVKGHKIMFTGGKQPQGISTS